MNNRRRTFERLIELAAAQHGFVRTADLEDAGISQTYLRKQVAAGRAVQRAQGLYRISAIPASAHDEFMEALLWANATAIGGESALALWDLADVNPRRITVVVNPSHRVRRHGGSNIRVIRKALRDREVDEVDGIPVVRPGVAVAQAMDTGVERTLIEQAISTGRTRGIIQPLAEARLRVALEDHFISKNRPERVTS
jgi:predicted transcriptional regulator of viral defense system